MKCCLKTENCCLKTQTKHPLNEIVVFFFFWIEEVVVVCKWKVEPFPNLGPTIEPMIYLQMDERLWSLTRIGIITLKVLILNLSYKTFFI